MTWQKLQGESDGSGGEKGGRGGEGGDGRKVRGGGGEDRRRGDGCEGLTTTGHTNGTAVPPLVSVRCPQHPLRPSSAYNITTQPSREQQPQRGPVRRS